MVPAALRRWLGGGRTGVKFCGLTREEEAWSAIAAGADALGFNFYAGSKRHVRFEAVADWVAGLPGDVARVAVVVQPDESLLRTLRDSGLFHALQFHGGEPADFCARWGGGYYVKACPVWNDASAHAAVSDPAPCLLLDAHAPGEYGGTGRTIDWSLAARLVPEAGRPVVLSGGLHAGNVAEAIAAVRPVAVDTASGVESAPGSKDAAKMRAFVAAVRASEDP